VNINSGNSSNSKFNNIGGVQSCFIFDEENNVLSFDSVKPETALITIIDFEGIKFTSKSFQFEINARQMLIINEKPIFKACLIKQKKQEHNQVDNCVEQEQEQPCIQVATDADTNATATADDAVVVSVSTKENVIEIIESSPLPPTPNHLETLEHVEIVESVRLEPHLEELSSFSSSVVKKNDDDNCNSGELIEVTLDLEKDDQKNLELVLKNPDDVYYKMYKDAKEKAKAAKNIAIEAYLAAEEIKQTYNLNNVDSSDSDDSDDSSNDNENDNE
jgi:co-chaperonin GroES (HSP10)